MSERLALRDDAQVVRDPAGLTSLVEGHIRAPVGTLGPALDQALAALERGTTEQELLAATTEAEGESAIMKLQLLLRRLEHGCWLTRSVWADGAPLATLHPVGHVVPPQPPPADLSGPLTLSRFALLRAAHGELRAESPLQSAFVVLDEPRLATLLGALARPSRAEELAASVPWLDPGALKPLLRLLRDGAIVAAADAVEPPAQAQWSFVDQLFHVRSRAGRNLGGFGGTYHREGKEEPLPAVQPLRGEAIALPTPDLAARTAADPPFGEVVERRRSIRVHDDANPITLAELGELLYRCARVRQTFHDGHQELSSRPYPAGGAC